MSPRGGRGFGARPKSLQSSLYECARALPRQASPVACGSPGAPAAATAPAAAAALAGAARDGRPAAAGAHVTGRPDAARRWGGAGWWALGRAGLRAAGRWGVLSLAVLSMLCNVWFAEGAPDSVSSWLPDVASDGKSTLFYMLPFRVFEFAVGGMLALCATVTTQPGRLANAGLVAGIALIAAATVFYDEGMLFPSWPPFRPEEAAPPR